MLAFALAALALCLAQEPSPRSAVPAGADSPLRVLFVGNSYTYGNDVPWMVRGLAAAEKGARPLEVESIAIGGATLRNHVESGAVAEKLATGRFEVLVLQEQSQLPLLDRAAFHAAVRELHATAAKTSTRVVFFCTWARRDHPEQRAGLEEAYAEIAAELGATMAPVGRAFERHAALAKRAGSKREQTPVAGNAASAPLSLYAEDGSHAAPCGSYLAAALLLEAIQGRPARALARELPARRDPALPTGTPTPPPLIALDEAQAALLARCVREAREGFAKERAGRRAKAPS
ncbi:MAG: hypothetical protein IPN34_02410 [Planctomycetes bacterium]|nr:hypothetical protein [Planctomycetota bacterium]